MFQSFAKAPRKIPQKLHKMVIASRDKNSVSINNRPIHHLDHWTPRDVTHPFTTLYLSSSHVCLLVCLFSPLHPLNSHIIAILIIKSFGLVWHRDTCHVTDLCPAFVSDGECLFNPLLAAQQQTDAFVTESKVFCVAEDLD